MQQYSKDNWEKIVTALLVAMMALPALARDRRPEPADLSSEARLIPDDEPGEAMRVTGRVLAVDGRTPVPGAVVYVYHADRNGRYTDPNRHRRQGRNRIHGWMRTGADGKYAFDSIRPGHYPGGTTPQHVHYIVTRPDGVEQRFDLYFEDDPVLSEGMRERASRDNRTIVVPITRDETGTWQCVADLVLDWSADET